MSAPRYFRIRENNLDSDVLSLFDATIIWEANPEQVEVHETVPNPTSKDGARTQIKMFEAHELEYVLKAARL